MKIPYLQKKVTDKHHNTYHELMSEEMRNIILSWQQEEKNSPKKIALGDCIIDYYYGPITKLVWHVLGANVNCRNKYFDDALQETCITFMNMLQNFDFKKNDNPFFYAKSTMIHKIYSYIESEKFHTTDWETYMIQKIKSYAKKYPDAKVSDIANFLNLSEETTYRYVTYLINFNNTSSLDSLDKEEINVASEKDSNLHETIVQKTTHTYIVHKLNSLLKKEEFDILNKMIGFEGDKYSTKQLATQYNCSQNEMYTKYKRILKKIQNDSNIMDSLTNCVLN